MGSGMLQTVRPAIEAHFLGQYLPWDSHENAKAAFDAGMYQSSPCEANWWRHENLDNAQTGLHDHMMYRKYGYGRGCAQLAVDVRAGRQTRAFGLCFPAHRVVGEHHAVQFELDVLFHPEPAPFKERPGRGAYVARYLGQAQPPRFGQ